MAIPSINMKTIGRAILQSLKVGDLISRDGEWLRVIRVKHGWSYGYDDKTLDRAICDFTCETRSGFYSDTANEHWPAVRFRIAIPKETPMTYKPLPNPLRIMLPGIHGVNRVKATYGTTGGTHGIAVQHHVELTFVGEQGESTTQFIGFNDAQAAIHFAGAINSPMEA